ncbi:MAG TPA: glycerophosphodiester phosphodiesterase family protein [Candidatus Saccharimonadales bacterium]|nr:glycerophosphodiester phosphodiesterase family protein [Candidatus Saccharimonadales bacterium]
MTTRTKPHAFFDYPYPIPLAHRGGDEVYPENTLAAFSHAYALGYRYFETDVHYTVGHELVAFHDTNLLRTAGSSGKVADLTAAARKSIRFQDKYPLPLLSELLEAFPDVYFNIDAKSDSAVEPLVATLARHGALHRVCLASFSAPRLARLRHLAPQVPMGASRYEIAALWSGISLPPHINDTPKYVEMPAYALWEQKRVPLITKRIIDRLHAKGHKILIWTVNEEHEMQQLLDLGVDGIFTDKPEVLKRVLQARSAWLAPTI